MQVVECSQRSSSLYTEYCSMQYQYMLALKLTLEGTSPRYAQHVQLISQKEMFLL